MKNPHVYHLLMQQLKTKDLKMRLLARWGATKPQNRCLLPPGGRQKQKPAETVHYILDISAVYLSASFSVSSCKKLITVSATVGNPRQELKPGKLFMSVFKME